MPVDWGVGGLGFGGKVEESTQAPTTLGTPKS